MMFVEEYRRLSLWSVDKLYRVSGVPRHRIMRLESGLDSIGSVPFYQVCDLADALVIDLELVYNEMHSDQYKHFLIQSGCCAGQISVI